MIPTLDSLDKRVAVIEKNLAHLLQPQPPLGEWKDWRSAIGKVKRTDLAAEVDAAAREIREADRRQVPS